MTTYATPEDELTIFFGPGAVNLHNRSGSTTGWVSGDVGLKLEYESHAPEGATRAVIELIAEQVDPILDIPEIHVQCELTQGDLVKLKGTIESILAGLDEDDDAYLS